jgi:hypothetical protein
LAALHPPYVGQAKVLTQHGRFRGAVGSATPPPSSRLHQQRRAAGAAAERDTIPPLRSGCSAGR